MSNRIPTLLMVALVLGSGAFAAEVYREIDENGNVIYSDRPRDASAEAIDVGASKADEEAVAARQEALVEAREARAAARAEAASEAEQARDVAAQRAENCEKARAYQQRVETARRLYDEDENGERTYYSAAEQDAALAKARDQVREWCDTDGT